MSSLMLHSSRLPRASIPVKTSLPEIEISGPDIWGWGHQQPPLDRAHGLSKICICLFSASSHLRRNVEVLRFKQMDGVFALLRTRDLSRCTARKNVQDFQRISQFPESKTVDWPFEMSPLSIFQLFYRKARLAVE